MCCYGSRLITEAFKKRMGRKKIFWGYKIYYKFANTLNTIYGRSDDIKGPGIIKARQRELFDYKGRIKRNKSYNRYYPSGIHVYTERHRAIQESLGFNKIVIKVKCHIDDLIIADETEAVFMKVIITKKEWKNVMDKIK